MEEVAALDALSVDYLIRLEQARDVRPSAQVVQSLSSALRLSVDQTEYLFTLAGHRILERSTRPNVPSGLTALVHDVSPLPAMVANHRLDVLAWNDIMAALLLGLDRPEQERNVLRMCFLDSRFDGFYGYRDDVVRGAVADLRAAWVAHVHDAQLVELIRELEDGSEEFAKHWRSREVSVGRRNERPTTAPEAVTDVVEASLLLAQRIVDLFTKDVTVTRVPSELLNHEEQCPPHTDSTLAGIVLGVVEFELGNDFA